MNRTPTDTNFTRAFLASEAAGGIVLMAIALLAIIVANSPLAPGYFELLASHVGSLSILQWINDALMALFFLLVGLEIKREALEGQLASWSQRVLPGMAAIGGMLIPALVYLAFNLGSGGHPRGWAIPSATDIAFALGVLSLLGPRVPVSLKLFLTALAIIDDLGAVLIIAFFYTAQLDLPALGAAAALLGILFAMNRFGVTRLLPYLGVGVALWVFVHASGIHATLAGVALALAIPLRARGTPLRRLEHGLHPWITFGVIPVFGFANAGVSLRGLSLADLGDAVPLGVALGLFFGKQIGVFAASWAAIRLGIARLPDGASWRQLYGVALLCGIGFTMSLFIGLLAFDSAALQEETKIGVLLGSTCSAIAGALLLRTPR
ncbi:MAG: Na+/H+ antiporter NhaA [Steroidobacteraceae bacterium]